MNLFNLSLIIRCCLEPFNKEEHSDKILLLKSILEKNKFNLLHLERLNHLIVDISSLEFNKLLEEHSEVDAKEFEVILNDLIK